MQIISASEINSVMEWEAVLGALYACWKASVFTQPPTQSLVSRPALALHREPELGAAL